GLGRLPRGHGTRLATAYRTGRPDRQSDLPGRLHRLRDLRCDPAHGRRRGREDPRGDQHRRGVHDGPALRLRDHRRPPRGRRCGQRGDRPPPGVSRLLVGSESPPDRVRFPLPPANWLTVERSFSVSSAKFPEASVATFEYSPEVRWSDQDMLGHVNNARLITLVEECRVRWMHEIRAGHVTGGGLLVAHQSIDYILPVMYGPKLTMTVTVKKLGNSSFTVNTRGEQDGQRVFDH